MMMMVNYPVRFNVDDINEVNYNMFISFINNLPGHSANLVYRRAIAKEIQGLGDTNPDRTEYLKFIIAHTTTMQRELRYRFE
jgi:hypothetical protein